MNWSLTDRQALVLRKVQARPSLTAHQIGMALGLSDDQARCTLRQLEARRLVCCPEEQRGTAGRTRSWLATATANTLYPFRPLREAA